MIFFAWQKYVENIFFFLEQKKSNENNFSSSLPIIVTYANSIQNQLDSSFMRIGAVSK